MEAISAYQRALELKPNYMRAWTNMGISQANVGQYDLSSRYYVRALGLNPRCGAARPLERGGASRSPGPGLKGSGSD